MSKCPQCGRDKTDFKFQVGEKVQYLTWNGKVGGTKIKTGRINHHSIGYNPPKYYVDFDDGTSEWLRADVLGFDVTTEEKMIFL